MQWIQYETRRIEIQSAGRLENMAYAQEIRISHKVSIDVGHSFVLYVLTFRHRASYI
jgi:hypothetical protein